MEKRKVRRGRPPLDHTVKRYKALYVRLREGEFEQIKIKAAEAGVSVAHYIRENVLNKKEEK